MGEGMGRQGKGEKVMGRGDLGFGMRAQGSMDGFCSLVADY